MTVKTEKNENNELIMDIKVDSKEVTDAYDKACRRLSKRVNIPGFRTGKAPRTVLEKHIGKEYIQREVLDAVLPKIFTNTVTSGNYETVTEPVVEYYNFEPDNTLSVKAKIELRPEFKICDYKSMNIETEEFKQSEDALEKELNDIKEKYAEYKAVEDRPSTDKDLVNIDFEGFVDGNAIKGGSAKGYPLDLAHSNFIPGFAEQIVGKNTGEEFTINVKFPDEYHDETIKGKNAEFKIKLNQIKEKSYPELTDELALKVGKFKTVDDLKADINKYLAATEKSENDKRATAVIYDKLLADTEIKIQEPMIQREMTAMMSEMKQRAEMQGQDITKLLETQGGPAFEAELREEAEKRIKTALIISEIAKIENIQVNGGDLEAKIQEISKLYNTSRETIIEEIRRNINLLQSLNQQIMSQKVTKFLLENAVVTYKVAEKKTKSEQKTEKTETGE